MKGALLGLLITLLGIPARVLVAWYALRQRGYPWWMLTPDDLPSHGPHFGYYEPTVRAVYSRWGKRIGDFYWLGKRNVLFGLDYYFKPAALHPQIDARGILCYAHLQSLSERTVRGRVTRYRVAAYRMWTVRLVKAFGHSYGIKAGWKVDRMIDDPFTPRQPINMDGRPMFSLRRLG